MEATSAFSENPLIKSVGLAGLRFPSCYSFLALVSGFVWTVPSEVSKFVAAVTLVTGLCRSLFFGSEVAGRSLVTGPWPAYWSLI